MDLCDRTFKATIHLLQKDNIDEFHQIVVSLKKK